MIQKLLVVLLAGSLAACASTGSDNERLAQLEQQQAKSQVLLEKIARRVGLAELVRPTKVSFGDGIVEGSPDAKLVLMEFTDLHCPFCKNYNTETWPQIKGEYVDTGKLVMVAHEFPLTKLHPRAGHAALALRCAAPQADYNQVKQFLFDAKKINDEVQADLVDQFKLDEAQFNACLKDKSVHDKINASLTLARDLGLKSTPSFILGRNENGTVTDFTVITGAKSYSAFKTQIDALLAK